MKFLVSLIIGLFLCGLIEGAAPVTHMYFAQIWLESNPLDSFETDLFIAGTLFPDIRYLGTIDRKTTHEKNITIEKIRETEAFHAGMRLHAYVDKQRERFIETSGIESYLNKIPKEVSILFLKILEDEILWDNVERQSAMYALQDVHSEELAIAEESIVLDWHNKMKLSFSKRPSEFLKDIAAQDSGFLKADAKTVKKWAAILPEYAKDQRFITYTQNMVKVVSARFNS